jgi:hypothetical protein
LMSANSTRWSRNSQSGRPRSRPPAPGRKRIPIALVPGGSTVGAGPVSGPAMNAPRPRSQTRSVHPSGRTRTGAAPSSGMTCAHMQATRGRSAGGAGRSLYPAGQLLRLVLIARGQQRGGYLACPAAVSSRRPSRSRPATGRPRMVSGMSVLFKTARGPVTVSSGYG